MFPPLMTRAILSLDFGLYAPESSAATGAAPDGSAKM